MTYERKQKESDFGSDSLHHHRPWRTSRNICSAILWAIVGGVVADV